MQRTRRTTITLAALAAAALLLAACTTTSKDAGSGNGSGATATGSSSASDDAADAKMLRETGSWAAGTDLCRVIAKGPWKTVGYESDPVDLVRTGDLPPGLDPGLNEKPDEVHEWAKATEYHDPSTLDDPGAITQAMEDAGFQAGAEAVWHNGHEEATITAVRFRDAEAAHDVLTAEATDYCSRAVSARALGDGTGIDIVRDSDATRVLAVVDDTVISLWACSCISSRSQDGISTWHDQFRADIGKPAPDTSGA